MIHVLYRVEGDKLVPYVENNEWLIDHGICIFNKTPEELEALLGQWMAACDLDSVDQLRWVAVQPS